MYFVRIFLLFKDSNCRHSARSSCRYIRRWWARFTFVVLFDKLWSALLQSMLVSLDGSLMY